MTTEQAKQLSESALNRLMAALEQGQSVRTETISRRDVQIPEI